MNINKKSSNVVWQEANVTRAMRERKNGHKSTLLWFTGLSGSGKSTLAHAVEERLHLSGANTIVLDGDNVRHGLCSDLGFSDQDRVENIRRIAEMAKLFTHAGVISLTAFISPFAAERKNARALFEKGEFIEIYCDASLDVCEQRDVKGLYEKARRGEIKHFTGIDSPYEVPLLPELVVPTGSESIEYCVDQVIKYLSKQAILNSLGVTVNETRVA